MAPEHRLSMELKWHELRRAAERQAAAGSKNGNGNGGSSSSSNRSAEAAAELYDILFRVPYTDLLDESDELLHHRWGNSERPATSSNCCSWTVALATACASP